MKCRRRGQEWELRRLVFRLKLLLGLQPTQTKKKEDGSISILLFARYKLEFEVTVLPQWEKRAHLLTEVLIEWEEKGKGM